MRRGSTGRGLTGWVSRVMCSRRSSVRSSLAARQQRADEGKPEWFGEDDLYPDARPALARLRAEGLWVGIAGNQTSRAGGLLRSLELPADMIATSDDWGAAKPDPAFFRRMIEVVPFDPGSILYVGDRLDNDIVPASAAGLRTALVRRGPWAWVQRDDPDACRVPDMRVDSLAELSGRIAAFNAVVRPGESRGPHVCELVPSLPDASAL